MLHRKSPNMAAEEEDSALLHVISKDREPSPSYGSLSHFEQGGPVPRTPTEGYCMVFEMEPQYGFLGRKASPYSIVEEDGTLKVKQNTEECDIATYRENGWQNLLPEWSDDRQDDLLANFKEAGIQYKIETDHHKYWFVIISTKRKRAQTWAERYNIDVPISPEAAVRVGRTSTKEGEFLLAERTRLSGDKPQFKVKAHRRWRHKKHARTEYDRLELAAWENIHIGYSSAVNYEVYHKEDGETVINHRLYLRILYDILTEGYELNGANFIVEKYLHNEYHPLVHFFALHDDSSPFGLSARMKCCKCNLFYDVDRHLEKNRTKKCCRCQCDIIGAGQSLRFCDSVREYYGESVGFYFHFLVHYTKWLYPMAVIGTIWFLIQLAGSSTWGIATPGSTVIVLVAIMWSTLMIENWYRRECKLRFKWGMMRYQETEVPRPSFKGEITVSKENGELIETYKNWYAYCCKITVSMSTMVLCVAIVVVIVATLFLLRGQNRNNQILTVGIGMANAVQIFIMNKLYTWLAYKLNEWEGHRLQQDYYNNLVIKRIIFIVFNSFYSLFYIGFWDDNPLYDDNEVRLEAIRTQLVTLFLMALFLQNTLEVLFPLIGSTIKEWKHRKEHVAWLHDYDQDINDDAGSSPQGKAVLLQAGAKKHTRRKGSNIQILRDIHDQMQLSPMPDVLDNTAEIVVLHGYIMLFVIIFPIMPLLALINNYMEIRVDFYNLITAQRPIPLSAAGLGVWKTVMSCFNIIAVFSNLAIITFRTSLITNLLRDFGDQYNTTVNLTIFYFCSALGLLFIIFLIRFAVSDYSANTREAIARQNACEKHLLMAPVQKLAQEAKIYKSQRMLPGHQKKLKDRLQMEEQKVNK
eukprot:231668_1